MSLISFLFKSKWSMSKPYTKRVKLNKYTLTSHAQNRIADKSRKISKYDAIDDLYRKELYRSPIYHSKKDNSLGFDRYGRRLLSYVTLNTNNIKSIRRYKIREAKNMGLSKKEGFITKV